MSHTYPDLPVLMLLCFQTTFCSFFTFMVDLCPLQKGKQQRRTSLGPIQTLLAAAILSKLVIAPAVWLDKLIIKNSLMQIGRFEG